MRLGFHKLNCRLLSGKLPRLSIRCKLGVTVFVSVINFGSNFWEVPDFALAIFLREFVALAMGADSVIVRT
jgi:hypothetical protein